MTRDTLLAMAEAIDEVDASMQASWNVLAQLRAILQDELDATAPPAPIVVAAGANLQAALDAAVPGAVLELEAGATFTGNFTLPVKDGSAPITVRGNSTIIRTPNSTPALRTIGNTAGWRFQGITFAAGASQSDIVALGDTVIADAALLPRDLVFEDCSFQADTSAKNGLSLNSRETTIRHCRFTGIKLAGIESHAIICTNGPGPFTIEDCYIEAGSIGVMFGGAAPAIPNLVPSDIVFQRNTVTRPLAMHTQTGWGVKNLFELKNARRVDVRGNVFEHNWPDGQHGYAIVLTVRANSLTAPWTTVQDVLFEHNIIRRTGMGFNILGIDNQVFNGQVAPSTPMDRVIVRNNLIYDLDRATWCSPTGALAAGVFMAIDGAPRNLTVERNTAVGPISGNILNLTGAPIPGFRFVRNIVQKLLVPYQTYGMNGNVVGEGNPAFTRYCPDAVVTENVLAGCTPSLYSSQPGNVFPTVAALVASFVDPASGNYRQTAFVDRGVDLDALEDAR